MDADHESRGEVSSATLRCALLVTAAAGLLALAAGPALAADGMPVLPLDWSGTSRSQTSPDVSSSGRTAVATWEETPWTPPEQPAFTDSTRVVAFNLDQRIVWSLHPGAYPAIPGEQVQPTVLVCGPQKVLIVYTQADRTQPGQLDEDLWIWQGDSHGNPAAGFPRLLVQGPGSSPTLQYAPSLGRVSESGHGKHIVLAWQDTRDNGPSAPQIYLLDLSRDSDGDGTPDYREHGFDTKTAGVRVSASAASQLHPAVGSSGVWWDDWRSTATSRRSGRGAGDESVWRCMPHGMITLDCRQVWTQSEPTPPGHAYISSLRPTTIGGAWLARGSWAGSGWEPLAAFIDRPAHLVTWLRSPGEMDTSGDRYVLTDGNGESTDADPDVLYFDQTTRQAVPVCDVSRELDAPSDLERHPAICGAAGGARIVWQDARLSSDFDPQQPATRLFQALVPNVTIDGMVDASGVMRFYTHVTPNERGRSVMLETGKKKILYGSVPWYHDFTILQKRTLSAGSTASFRWTPSRPGTYFMHVRFIGEPGYADGATHLWEVPHVGNVSEVIKVVVH